MSHHLVNSKYKPIKYENEAGFHHSLLSMTTHYLALFDHITGTLAGKHSREMSEGVYPGLHDWLDKNVKVPKGTAQKIHQFSHSHVALARLHKQDVGKKGGGLVSSSMKVIYNAAGKAVKFLYRGIKLAAKYGKKAAVAAFHWIKKNPGQAAELIAGGADLARGFIGGKKNLSIVPDLESEKPETRSKYADLLASDGESSDSGEGDGESSDDEKAPAKEKKGSGFRPIAEQGRVRFLV